MAIRIKNLFVFLVLYFFEICFFVFAALLCFLHFSALFANFFKILTCMLTFRWFNVIIIMIFNIIK